MKILIDNRTNLTNTQIGNIIDDMQEIQKGNTQYYGKWNGYELEFKDGRKYKVETMVMKKYFKVLILVKEAENGKKEKI